MTQGAENPIKPGKEIPNRDPDRIAEAGLDRIEIVRDKGLDKNGLPIIELQSSYNIIGDPEDEKTNEKQ
jgi:hypothetical protein